MIDPFPEIHTPRFRLRQFGAADLAFVYKGLSDPQVIRYYGVSFDSPEATRTQLEWYAALEKNKTGIWWAICDAEEQTPLGAAGLNNLVAPHRKAELGFWLLPEYWGNGIIQEAVPFICRYAFDTLGLHRIEAFVETENENSARTLRKLNFRHEGTMSDCEVKNGKFLSLDIYARIRR